MLVQTEWKANVFLIVLERYGPVPENMSGDSKTQQYMGLGREDTTGLQCLKSRVAGDVLREAKVCCEEQGNWVGRCLRF